MAYIGDSQGAAEIDPNSFIKPLGVFAHDVEFDEIVLQLCNGYIAPCRNDPKCKVLT